MDDWDFLDEVDVIQKWPAEMRSSVFESKKWSERKAGLEALNTIMEQNPRLSTSSMTIYSELMDEIRKILDRESNIVVVCTAAKTVELLAKGLRTKFGGFVGMVFPFLIKRAKDKKKNVRDAVSSSLEAVSETTTAERIQKDVLDWFAIPSPESKQTLLEFLYRYFVKMERISDLGFVKAIVGMIVKCATDSDVNVREKACQSLGSLRRLMADALTQFIVPISTDAAKMEKIAQFEKQAKEEFDKLQASKPRRHAMENNGNGGSAEEVGSSGALTESSTSDGIDSWEMLEAVDVAKKMDKNLETCLVDKNWKERLSGCEASKKEIDSVGRIEISERLREIVVVFIRIIEKDVNVNVAACSANNLTGIAIKSRFAYSALANKSFPICLDKLKDKKAVLRDALNEYIDAAATTTPLTAYYEAVQGGLTSKNPQTRQQTALFLARYFAKQDEKTMDIESLKNLAEAINKTSNDADKDVRDAALRTIAAIRKSIGELPARRMFADIFDDTAKLEKISKIVEELVEQFGNGSSVEMRRLAKHYGIGGGSKKTEKPVTAKPSTAKTRPAAPRPVSANPVPTRPVTSRPVQPVKSDVSNTTTTRTTVPATRATPRKHVAIVSQPKSFVARPAPSFCNNKHPSRPASAIGVKTTPGVPAPSPMNLNFGKPVATVSQPKPKPFVARPAPSFCNNKHPSRPTSAIGVKTTPGIREPSPMNSNIRSANPTSSSIRLPSPSSSLPKPINSSSKIRPPSSSRFNLPTH